MQFILFGSCVHLQWTLAWKRRQEIPYQCPGGQSLHKRRERCAVQSPRRRIPFALDSQVCLGSLIKGRSASVCLNAVLKRSLPYPIAGGIFGHYLYYPSSFNGADGPTRSADPKPPDMHLPEWFWRTGDDFCTGLDDWLNSIGSLQNDLPFGELGRDVHADLSPNRRIKLKPPKRNQRIAASADPGVPPEGKAPELQQRDPEPERGPSHEENMFCRHFSSVPATQFFFKDACSCFEVPGVLDLYSGNCGVAKQLVKHGAPWALTFDWNAEVMKICWLQSKAFFLRLSWRLFAPPCRAITPPVRSRRWPKGVPHMPGSMKQKVKEGNIHDQFRLSLIMLAIANGWAFWCENPDKFFLWLQRGWQDFFVAFKLRCFQAFLLPVWHELAQGH